MADDISLHCSPPPPRLIQAAAGAPLGSDAVRTRPMGRIGGVVGHRDAAARERIRRALGPNAQILPDSASLIVDSDHCGLYGEPLTDPRRWRDVIRSGELGQISGAFALACLDVDGSLVLARDAIGHRTLFHAFTAEGIAFAATIPALLASGLVARQLNLSALETYLTYSYLPGRETLLQGVFELLPGECVRIHQNVITRSPFWRPPEEPANWRGNDDLRCSLRERLEGAVRLRLPPGEAVGVSLSGGLDSSLIVALASRLHDAPVTTYSISFGANYANELEFSSQVANHCQTAHRIVELSPQVVLYHLDDAISLLSDPIGDPLTVPNALLFREAAAETGVVLNGEGGDPCFGGPKNLPMLLAELYGDPYEDPLARERAYLRAHLKCYDDLGTMFTADVQAALADSSLEERLTPYLGDSRWRTFITRLQAINVVFKGGHHILPKVDALSFPFGVLARSPLFDRELVELAFAIPPQQKLHGSVEKYLLKQAVSDLLPPAIIDRPKCGMLVPVEAWFQGPLLRHARERLLDGLAPYHLFRRDYLERLLNRQLGGLRPRYGAKIWLLITLEAWLRSVL